MVSVTWTGPVRGYGVDRYGSKISDLAGFVSQIQEHDVTPFSDSYLASKMTWPSERAVLDAKSFG
ncbi:pentatricopeptide repeat-containing protein [Dorcoceras hygrometricum]|uniref:Pentatricopeptide repeat-containing protein n=1 Tax=Dorcoceras hygrometricum TaxID=472368 RepID=A0A2Z7C0M9_9LAMI|nr:pentatricopeptide repeat-containing protein [Dorcoceras hygrometricum]